MSAGSLPRPSKILAVGLNYTDHAEEVGAPIPERPVVFAKFPSSLTSSGSAIMVPADVDEADYEAELAVVVGRSARHVGADDALDFVAGYATFNDITDRRAQREDGQWTLAKSYDTFGPIGPRITPASDIGDPQSLRIAMTLNGEVVQSSTTANMIFPVATIISYLSSRLTLDVGDIIITGTPAGVGGFGARPRYLTHGDVMTVTIDGLEPLTNHVVIL